MQRLGSPAIDQLWLDAAARLGFPVERGDDAYVHWDGARLLIAGDDHLDEDDTLAQLVLHEICHALTQGLGQLGTADWGLDNVPEHEVRERACLRLQAHLLGAYGLRDLLYPTTPWKAFYLSIPGDAFTGGDAESIPVARVAALTAARAPYGPELRRTLDQTARLAGRARHKSGNVAGTSSHQCGQCAFRTEGGMCRKAEGRVFVEAAERACARFEELPDCRECGACCRSAYDAVFVTERAPVIRKHPELIERVDGTVRLRRIDDHCAALVGEAGGPWNCRIYEDRPRTCRDFTRQSRNCLEARRRVGLSI